MFRESLVDKILYRVKKLIPKSVFNFFAPMYHASLAWSGAVMYGFPSRSMKVIGVTGTKGKSTTVFLISKLLEGSGESVAAIGSLGFKIKDKEWPNNLKMTMPGRFKLQKFLSQAKKAGCKYIVLEVTSEGIKQKRHLGIRFDCAVFTNLHKEHLESHGSFENYYKAKQELFEKTDNVHVLNADDENLKLFSGFHAKRKIFYGIGVLGVGHRPLVGNSVGDMRPENVELGEGRSSFEVYGTKFDINFGGRFNVYNCLAALAVGAMYNIDLPAARPILEKIESIKGRMEFVRKEPFAVVVDYAHTPDSLKEVYKTLKPANKRLICVLGAAGGGRDKWKRPEFGKIASMYCDRIILTDEDPFDENPAKIIQDIRSGIPKEKALAVKEILDRREAIKVAINMAQEGDVVVITGKGSETSMAVAGGRKIPWSDRDIVLGLTK